MIILYDSLQTWHEVVDEYPVIGGVWVRGDWEYEDVEGVPVPTPGLTSEPVVTPAVASDGRRMQCHDFGDEELQEFREYWADWIADGRIQILDSPPEDWKPEGWVEAGELPEDWEAMEEE